jgi:hypothetical protein
MIHVPFDPEQLEGEDRAWWEDWSARAQRATDELRERVGRGEPAAFDPALWTELKRWLFRRVFHGKCAYCEGKVTPQSYGDAEHWRPKGAVTVRNGAKRVVVERDGTPHPGYWWLAYEWTNLLPACEACNGGGGKQAQFPVAGTRVFDPAEAEGVAALDATEEPLLLHPFRGPDRDPAKHLSFDEFGHVSATGDSALGHASIEAFALNRAELAGDRLEHLQRAADGFRAAWLAVEQGITWEAATECWSGPRNAYALATRQFLARRLAMARSRLPEPEALPD